MQVPGFAAGFPPWKEEKTTASLSKDAGGQRRIQFGKVPQRLAEQVELRAEQLIAAVVMGHAVDAETARWVAGIPDKLASKLAKVGLIEPRQPKESSQLGQFLEDCLASRANLKPNTKRDYRQTMHRVEEYLGE